jgi:peptidoglycan/LPS O-acetylase OafA/YrhL
MEYRREIDGLRALAVLPVILFHAGFETFNGGFVGVDVFFVISGYLITTIILAELEKGKFSITNFYERRARRILPALFLVMMVCIPFAWFWLLPSDIIDFSQSLVAVSIFASNVLFWRESGYFDAAVELKPLLHTWSLAVEEQYYVIFPILLMFVWKLGKRWTLVTLGLLFVSSLAVAQWAAYAEPAAGFYLLPTRGWELLMGAFAAFYLSESNGRDFGRFAGELCGWLGVALILYAVLTYNKATPFPGLYALVPTLGTLLIILFATQQTTVGRCVGNKVFVGIGMISYSAYLWHQPLFAFMRHKSLTEPSHASFLMLSLLTFGLAYLSWKFVEAPFRNRKTVSRNGVFAFALLGSSLFFFLGIIGHIYGDRVTELKFRSSPGLERSYQLLKLAKDTSPVFIDSNRFDNGECRFSVLNIESMVSDRLLKCHNRYGSGILVFGDSHATNLYHSIVRNEDNSQHLFIIGITKNGCHLPAYSVDCQYSGIIEFLKENPGTFKFIIYEKAGHLMLNLGPDRRSLRDPGDSTKFTIDTNILSGVGIYLDSLSKYANVIWFGPRLEPLVTDKEFLRFGCEANFSPTHQHKKVFEDLDIKIKEFSENKSWRYISQNKLVQYNFPADFGNCDSLLWMDMNHFSKDGEEVFGGRFTVDRLVR